jgi:hypothetical protein
MGGGLARQVPMRTLKLPRAVARFRDQGARGNERLETGTEL